MATAPNKHVWLKQPAFKRIGPVVVQPKTIYVNGEHKTVCFTQVSPQHDHLANPYLPVETLSTGMDYLPLSSKQPEVPYGMLLASLEILVAEADFQNPYASKSKPTGLHMVELACQPFLAPLWTVLDSY